MVREDPFGWLREVGTPEVVAHLSAERAWYDAATGHLHSLVTELLAEMKARTPETDLSVPLVPWSLFLLHPGPHRKGPRAVVA